ncbi:MAG: hypothetical protein OHK0045_22720 [Raineya sp.]
MVAIWNFIGKIFRKEKSKFLSLPQNGRQTQQNQTFLSDNTPLEPDFGVEWLPILQRYATFNADVSLAVDNIVNLSNTNYIIEFEGVSDKKQSEYLQLFKDLHKSLSLGQVINGLFRQLAVYGCISSEMVVSSNMKSIEEIAIVNPYSIRFFSKNGKYLAHQKKINGGYQELNPNTYTYITLTKDEYPYGIPPMLAALEGIGIERSLMKSFQKIADKFGLFGFLEVLLTAPAKRSTETDEQYYQRCEGYIERVRPQVEKSMSSGYAIGYKNSHEFRLTGGNTDASNAKEMMMLNDVVKMAGLKQDPNLLGRQQSRAETFGRVLLTIFTAKVTSYQEVVADFLEKLFELYCLLQGQAVSLSVRFDKPTLIDEKLSEEAISIKIDNLIKLCEKGIISIEQFAQEMGYLKVAKK